MWSGLPPPPLQPDRVEATHDPTRPRTRRDQEGGWGGLRVTMKSQVSAAGTRKMTSS